VTQPRQPCYKLAAKHGPAQMPKWVQDTGYTGYYGRVLVEGEVPPEGEVAVLQRHPLRVSIAFVNEVLFHRKNDTAAIQAVLAVDALAERLRASLRDRLDRMSNEETRSS